MARLPTPGSDTGNWGNILNEYLATSHNPDGTNFGPVYFVENFGAKGDGESDDTKAINDCFDAVQKTGGVMAFQAKTYRFTSLNFTNAVGVTIQGMRGTTGAAGQTRKDSRGQNVLIGTQHNGWTSFGTVLWPLPGAAGKNLLDFSGSNQITMRDIDILDPWFSNTATPPSTGVLIGWVQETAYFVFENIYIAGRFSNAALYFGASLSTFTNCAFYNYFNNATSVIITSANTAGVRSEFTELNPQWGCSETHFQQCQFVDAAEGMSQSGNINVVLDGARNFSFEHIHSISKSAHFAIVDSPNAIAATNQIRVYDSRCGGSAYTTLVINSNLSKPIDAVEFNNVYSDASQYFLRIQNTSSRITGLRIVNPTISNKNAALIASDSLQTDWLTYSYIECKGLPIAANASIPASNVFFGASQINIPAGLTDLSKKL